MIHFVKKEILGGNKEDAKLQIMGNAGMLKNMTDEETELFNEAVKRKSLFRDRTVILLKRLLLTRISFQPSCVATYKLFAKLKKI